MATVVHGLISWLVTRIELLGILVVHASAIFPRTGSEGGDPSLSVSEEITDEELMRRYVAGERKCFDVIMMRYRRRIYSFIYRWTWSREKTDELFQESFLKVVRSADSYDPERRFSTWLYTVVRNVLIDDARKKRLRFASLNRPLFAGEEKRTLADVTPDQDAHDGEHLARKKELQEALARALGRLNPDQREVFLLRHEQGLQFDEIAEVMGCPVNTAKTRMRYALESLQRDLREFTKS